jgi:integrase/recombinase XerC
MVSMVTAPRDRALLGVLLGAGLRVSEVAAMDLDDILEDSDGEMLLHVRAGKGNKSRTVPVRSDVAGLMRTYLIETGRYMGGEGPLFLAWDPGAATRTSRRLSPRSIAYIVARVTEEAAIVAKRISPHALRHTYALRALRKSGNVVAVSKLLGHSQLSTTQRYVDHLETSELRLTVPHLPGLEVSPAQLPSGANSTGGTGGAG